jgi:hypothetical protein
MYTYTADVYAREETKTEEETKEGHSIMLSTMWPLTVQDEGCEEVREEGAVLPVLSRFGRMRIQ